VLALLFCFESIDETAPENEAKTLFFVNTRGTVKGMRNLILFTTTAPYPLTDELSRQGYQVREALAISEVFSLADEWQFATIIITAEIDPERAKVIQQHYPTLHLKAHATVRDVLWELSHRTEYAMAH
jgi:hypothetical protein